MSARATRSAMPPPDTLIRIPGHAPFTPAMARSMSEATLQGHILATAGDLGWRRYHTHNSRRSQPGFPDLCMLHRAQDRVIFAELKRETEKLRPEQHQWADDLLALSCVEFYLWRPSHWLSGDVIRILAQRPRSPELENQELTVSYPTDNEAYSDMNQPAGNKSRRSAET